MALEFLLAIHEEEGLVLANGATMPRELIQIEFLRFSGRRNSCVESVLRKNSKSVPWKSWIRLGGDQHMGPARFRTRGVVIRPVP